MEAKLGTQRDTCETVRDLSIGETHRTCIGLQIMAEVERGTGLDAATNRITVLEFVSALRKHSRLTGDGPGPVLVKVLGWVKDLLLWKSGLSSPESE